jgi:hypothetical protein
MRKEADNGHFNVDLFDKFEGVMNAQISLYVV